MESLLKKAKEQEKKYEWLESADFYKEAASLVQEDYEKASEIQERIGCCFLRAAFQAETNEQFRKILKQSADAYQKTINFFQKTETEDKEAKICHAKAMIAYVNARLTPDVAKRRKFLDELWKLENDALEIYKKTGNQLAIGKMYNNLSEWLQEKQFLESRWFELKRLIIEGINYANEAINVLSKTSDKYELARAYCWINVHYGTAIYFRALDPGDVINRNFLEKGLELAGATQDAYLITRLKWIGVGSENLTVLIDNIKEVVKYAELTKDNYLIGHGKAFLSACINNLTEDDPDRQRQKLRESQKLAQDAIRHLSIIDDYSVRFTAYNSLVMNGKALAMIEPDSDKQRLLLERLVERGRKILRNLENEMVWYSPVLFITVSNVLFALSQLETQLEVKKKLLEETLTYNQKELDALQKTSPLDYYVFSNSHNSHAQILVELAKMEKGQKKIVLFEKAVSSMEKCVKLIEKDKDEYRLGLRSLSYGLNYYRFGRILEQLNLLTKDKLLLDKAIENYKVAIKYFTKIELATRVAESYWQIARLKNHLGDNLGSAQNYQAAAQKYVLAVEKTPKLKEFYTNHSKYMQAWSEIEKAKHNHKIEEYTVSRSHYENAAKLHESSQLWSYLAPNYLAWANIEKAENFSRNEKTQQAKHAFQEALQQFSLAKQSIKQKLEKTTTSEEKEMTQKLFESSDLRRKYCQARILLEDAILLDREGKYLQSSKNYGEASKKFITMRKNVASEAERKELKYLGVLCQAWEKMANAEETTSAESYLEAAELFEQAKDYCYTKKASFWALGNSSFCKGLAAQNQFQKTLDRSYHSKATKFVKQAANYYKQAGYQKASDYARATQRLFDAYLYMNSAEDEVDPEKKTKYYQLAEHLLQIAANAFSKAEQADKTTQVQSILSTVREEKALAASLNAVMQAPTIASTTQSFTAPSATNEVSVGLENFERANVQANLVTAIREVKVGESFCLSVEFVNAGKEPALLMHVDDFVPSDFVVVKKPEIYRIEESCLNMKGKQLAPLKLVEVKLTLQASKKGEYSINPRVHYLDELGQNKSLQLKTLQISVEEVILENRVSTGTQELDSLLLGGIPQEYAVALTGSPSDERDLLIKNFLDAGIKENQIIFYIATEAEGLENLLEKFNFYLFLCNPKPKTKVPDLPNVFKLRSKTDLTNLSISLAKAYRNIDPSRKKRICVEIISDVLVDYETKATRKWISELITDLGSKGFTTLAVMDPKEHPPDQATTVINLFDGEIELTQTEDPLECKKSVRVKKLRNQDYIKNPICLT